MESRKDAAEKSILSFLRLPNVRMYCLEKEDISEAFRLAKELKHDVYDLVYAVLARKTKSEGIITTDTDFEKICSKLGLKYVNPVPNDVLKGFSSL